MCKTEKKKKKSLKLVYLLILRHRKGVGRRFLGAMTEIGGVSMVLLLPIFRLPVKLEEMFELRVCHFTVILCSLVN